MRVTSDELCLKFDRPFWGVIRRARPSAAPWIRMGTSGWGKTPSGVFVGFAVQSNGSAKRPARRFAAPRAPGGPFQEGGGGVRKPKTKCNQLT